MKIYIAGKITDNPNFQQEFGQVEKELLAQGYTVLNPAKLPKGFTQQEYMHICYAMIDVCDVVHFLPNWKDSKGAKLEFMYATAKKKGLRGNIS